MSNEENAQQVGESAGSQLRRGREQKGMSVSDVADAQHLRPAIIQAIESGDYQQIDSELFLKGYVRAYAKQVGLDADAVVATLDQELEPLRQQKAEALEASPLVDIERRKRQKRRAGRVLILLIAIAVVAFIAFEFLDNENRDGGNGPESAEESQSLEESESVPDSQPLSAPDPDAAADTDDESVVPELETQSGVVPEDNSEIDSAQARDDSAISVDQQIGTPNDSDTVAEITDESDELDETRIPVVTSSTDPALREESRTGDTPGAGRLQISFTSDCWIEVTDSTGARLVSSLQRDGDRIDVSGQLPLNVVIGAVDAVTDIRFEGESVDLSEYRVVNNRTQFTLEI